MPQVRRKPIPNVTSRSTSLELNDYSAGMDNYSSNDRFPVRDGGSNKWRLAQDARIITLGEYETRKGCDFHSDAAGETQDDSETSTTGAAEQSFSETSWLAQQFVTTSAGRLSKVSVNLKNSTAGTGTILVEIWSDSSNSPSVRIARSSIASSDLTSSYAYHTARFIDAPLVAGGTAYWVMVKVQPVATNTYSWSSTTSTGGAKSSSNSGVSWTTESYALNFRQYYATDGGVKGEFRGYKSDGTKVTLFAHGTSLYSVNNVTGALTAIKTGLSASATRYRFVLIDDIVYYCNSYDGLRKWDFTTESQVNSTNYSMLCLHKGLLFGVRVDEQTRVDYSNFGEYEVFTSTDFLYAKGPKTGDPITAILSLNGYLVLFTKNSKRIVSGDDNATFTEDEAPDQKPTYSQETVTDDGNFMFFLSDDGVYRSNGSEAQLMSENIYEEIRSMPNKEDATIVVNRGRLYLWYTSRGSDHNDSCYVWNLNYGSGSSDSIESHDTIAPVARAFSAFQDDDGLLVASSLMGQVYWQEQDSNDYHNLGGDIQYELQTHYHTYGAPAVNKEVRYWVGRFASQSDNYTVNCQYAYDQRDSWVTQSELSTQGSGATWGSGAVWGAFTWGRTAEVQFSTYVPGEHRRIAFRYQHYAARQPHKFLGHSMIAQIKRLR